MRAANVSYKASLKFNGLYVDITVSSVSQLVVDTCSPMRIYIHTYMYQ